MTQECPIAFINQPFTSWNLLLSVYEELMIVVFAVSKWQHYLVGHKLFFFWNKRCMVYINIGTKGLPIHVQKFTNIDGRQVYYPERWSQLKIFIGITNGDNHSAEMAFQTHGFRYQVEYKKGKDNTVVDTPSKQPSLQVMQLQVSFTIFTLW